ncbi:receptor-type tyrosine-protein kinase FLT3-like [Xyrauchen texanus]|uniref:receptor-type tyrosine-protein kinase FLT3-like n=1 Tax=Xyrauchen texanus TaxID=154827 RepID=UPI0022429B0D|nr:receptor-type tyrosine-protein kinase FLT3-like [Xyrauchen texanus]
MLCIKAMHLGKRLFVVLLLLQWSARSLSAMRDGSTDTHAHCVTDGSTVNCTLQETDLLNSDPIKLGVVEGQTVDIYAACRQNSSERFRCLCYQRVNSTMHLLQHSERVENGTYTLLCGNHNLTVVQSPKRMPSVPVLKAIASAGQKNTADIVCISEGNPKPTIKWNGNNKNPKEVRENRWNRTESSLISSPDCQKCCASNLLGEECSEIYDYDLETKEDGQKVQIFLKSGQSLLLRCILKTRKSPELRWYFNNSLVSGVNSVTSLNYYYWMELLTVESVNVMHSGEYICKSKYNHTASTYVMIFEKDKIDILQLNANNSILAQNKASFCFQALVFSYPKAQCHWIIPNQTKIKCRETHYHHYNSTFKLCYPKSGQYQIKLENQEHSVIRNVSLCISDIPRIKILKDLSFTTCTTQSSTPVALSWKICPSHTKCIDPEDWNEMPVAPSEFPDSDQFCQKKIVFARSRSYREDHLIKCCITNIEGTHCSDQMLLQTNSYVDYVICFVLIVVLLVVIFALMIFIRIKKPMYQSQIQMIQMVGPNNNDYIYIDFRDFKYDPKWEFPRENLELGIELGSGAFGMVLHAKAYGISKQGVSSQVAVKMLKEKHQAVEKEALMSELKMLTHIGQHENIVNLLGACTGLGPIYLIFQYCCNGDLLNYLKSNREHFHNYLTDAFNRDRFRGLYRNFQQKRNFSECVEPSDDPCLHNTSPVFKGKENEALLSPSISSVSTIEELQSLAYDDLLSFSFQVAKGMDFLSAKNCIHRDLAARNVLVTHGRQVKIGDFGLARDIENDSNYVVKGNVRLPVKWMAPESIFKGVYTMQSDVWAYGILLWEIFSLGVTPYPGKTVNNTFYTMIESGYHMEQPYYASESVYNVMCHCWSLDPADRPCFSKLVAFMQNELAAFEERIYYNIGGYCHSDLIYQNAPVTPDPTLLDERQDVCQTSQVNSSSNTENSDEGKAMEDLGSVITGTSHLKIRSSGQEYVIMSGAWKKCP